MFLGVEWNQMTEFNEALEVGSVVEGVVVKIEEKQVFVDIGQKSEGIIPISELSTFHVENASDAVKLDEKLTLSVKKIEDEEIILSKKQLEIESAWEDLQEKYDNETVFDTTVTEVVDGGLVVNVGLRGFIPASLVETYFVEDFSDY